MCRSRDSGRAVIAINGLYRSIYLDSHAAASPMGVRMWCARASWTGTREGTSPKALDLPTAKTVD